MGMQTMGHGGREAEKVRKANIAKVEKIKRSRIEKEEQATPLEKAQTELRAMERAYSATMWDLNNNSALKNSPHLIIKASEHQKDITRLKALVEELEQKRDEPHE